MLFYKNVLSLSSDIRDYKLIENKTVMKKIITLLAVIFCVNAIWAAKERIVIEYLTSEQQELELEKISTIEFTDELIKFVDFAGEVVAQRAADDVRKISFVEEGTAVEDVADVLMVVYPNPTMEALFVQGLNIGDVVRIYSLDGMLVKKQVVDSEIEQIMVNDIVSGTYILQSNTKVVKFIKK